MRETKERKKQQHENALFTELSFLLKDIDDIQMRRRKQANMST